MSKVILWNSVPRLMFEQFCFCFTIRLVISLVSLVTVCNRLNMHVMFSFFRTPVEAKSLSGSAFL